MTEEAKEARLLKTYNDLITRYIEAAEEKKMKRSTANRSKKKSNFTEKTICDTSRHKRCDETEFTYGQ